MKFSGTFTANAWRHAALLTIICLAAPLAQVRAQANLTFHRVTANWPIIELYFTVGCGGNPVYNMSEDDFRIFEDGVPIEDYTLWCPNPTLPCPISVSLVFDASGPMAGSNNAGAKQAGHAFIDLMDGSIDEASVIWFTSMVTVHQQMTTIKPMLDSAVDALPANGMTAVWDGGYTGLLELINNGVNQCRAVVLLSGATDNASSRTTWGIIALANRHRIRIFTVGIGASFDVVDLDQIALMTGGKFYQTRNPDELSAIYQEIFTTLRESSQECQISYERDCMDGAMHTVELQLNNFCGGNDSKSKSYRAPMDSTTFLGLDMNLGTNASGGGIDLAIPLLLTTPIDSNMFYPFQFTLEYDTACVEFIRATTPLGTLLAGVPVTWTPAQTGATIFVPTRTLIDGSGTLMQLNFRTKNPADTTCCVIRGVGAAFEQGCFAPLIGDGEICIYPGTPIIGCSIDGPSELTWTRGINDYVPGPFPISARFFNMGDTEALNPTFKITYDTAAVKLVSPLMDVQTGTGSLGANSFADVTWQLAARHRATDDSTEICIMASFDDAPDVVCCFQVFIPLTEPILTCTLDAPAITADSANLRYAPMPFAVTLTASNTGGVLTDSLWATISIPMDLDLAPPDVPHAYTKLLLPAMLPPFEDATVSWMLLHPRTNIEKNYTITVWLKTANADSSKCEINVTIPALPVTSFPFTLTANGPLTFCDGESVVLDAGAGYASYRWSNGGRGQLLAVTQSGDYYCKVEHSDGRIGMSDTIHVTVIPKPAPRIAITGSIPMCENDSVLLDAGAGYISYLWSTGGTEQTLTARTPGAYYVQVRGNDNCEGYSDTVVVTTKNTPSKPRISRNLDWLYASSDVGGFIWYLNGIPLPNPGSNVIRLTETGRYQVEVRQSNGCSAISDPFDVITLTIDGKAAFAKSAELNVYPEPAVEMLRIGLTGAANQTVTLALYDVLGRAEVIHTGVLPDGGAVFTHSLRNRTPGVYYIVALLGEAVLVKRVTKM